MTMNCCTYSGFAGAEIASDDGNADGWSVDVFRAFKGWIWCVVVRELIDFDCEWWVFVFFLHCITFLRVGDFQSILPNGSPFSERDSTRKRASLRRLQEIDLDFAGKDCGVLRFQALFYLCSFRVSEFLMLFSYLGFQTFFTVVKKLIIIIDVD